MKIHSCKCILTRRVFSRIDSLGLSGSSPNPSSKYSISVRGPKIWSEFLTKEEKGIQLHSVFLGKIKTKLLESENERKYF